jgi:hypothetical protein
MNKTLKLFCLGAEKIEQESDGSIKVVLIILSKSKTSFKKKKLLISLSSISVND